MIFNMNKTATGAVNESAIVASPYEANLEGALMHVYENECNFNAMMKAVGLSELKYYQETGKDLFLTEANAFTSLIGRAKEFFKKVIEKVVSLFKKFAATINSYVMTDKEFIKKYKASILDKSSEAGKLKMSLYKYPGLADDCESKVNDALSAVSIGDIKTIAYSDAFTTDKKEETVNGVRAKLLAPNYKDADASTFRKNLKDYFYGKEKEEVEGINVVEFIGIIEKSADQIDAAKKVKDAIVAKIDKFITDLDAAEKKQKEFSEKVNDEGKEAVSKFISKLNNAVDGFKTISNICTEFFGAQIGALKHRNRQAKAVCVKVLSTKAKKESYSESSIDDIFAGVTIR
jgi:hypothetical protein